jgi:transcription elongation factor Elf1
VKKKRNKPLRAGSLDIDAEVSCPFCGQSDVLYVDPGGGAEQVYTEDCAVCCRPRVIHVEPDGEGGARVWVERGE